LKIIAQNPMLIGNLTQPIQHGATKIKLQEMYENDSHGHKSIEEYTGYHKGNLDNFNQFEAKKRTFEEWIDGLYSNMIERNERKS